MTSIAATSPAERAKSALRTSQQHWRELSETLVHIELPTSDSGRQHERATFSPWRQCPASVPMQHQPPQAGRTSGASALASPHTPQQEQTRGRRAISMHVERAASNAGPPHSPFESEQPRSDPRRAAPQRRVMSAASALPSSAPSPSPSHAPSAAAAAAQKKKVFSPGSPFAGGTAPPRTLSSAASPLAGGGYGSLSE